MIMFLLDYIIEKRDYSCFLQGLMKKINNDAYLMIMVLLDYIIGKADYSCFLQSFPLGLMKKDLIKKN